VETHNQEQMSSLIRRAVLTEDQDVPRDLSLVHMVRREDEAERDVGVDGAGGRDVATPLELGRGLLRARRRERRLRTERESDDHEEREQQPAHAISV